jgi:histidinol-phosphate aminotransferase
MARPRDDVSLMEGYHSPQLDVPVRLNTNESPEAPPAAWLDAVRSLAGTIDWNRYPDREAGELRARLGALHGVGPERVFVANGSNEVLQCLLLAYGGSGRTAAVWEPTYALHSHISRLVGTDVAVGERAADFALDPDEVARVFRDASPAVAFLCSPNNPTGMIESEQSVRSVLAQAREHDTLLIVDEAYGQFASWSAVSLVAADEPLVVTRTFSKTWSMAAARLGYAIAPEDIVDQCWKVALPYHLDAFKQAAGLLALSFVDEMERRVARLVEERGRLVRALTDLPVDVWPSGANFVLFRPREAEGDAVWKALVERGVLVRNCASWPRLEGCLRVTVGTPAEDDEFLSALTDALGAAR